MGTTTANKQGLRAAAEEKRNKHAQRTPLPPKGGVTKVEVPDYAERYGAMTEAQLRQVLRTEFKQPVKGNPSKGELLTAVLRAERESRSETREDRIQAAQQKKRERRAAEDQQEAAAKAASKPVAASTAPVQGKTKASVSDTALDDSKSFSKASGVMDVAVKHGWDVKPERFEGDVIELLMTRNDEALWISWTNGVLTTDPMPSYTIADRTVKLRNASAVKQYAARTPEVGAKELERVSSNRFFRKRPTEPKRSRLPFDPALATDAEVLAALVGKSVAWHNQYRESEETAIVGRPRGRQPVELRAREDGQRVVWFCCPQTGFRAFALSQLTKVGKPVHLTKGQRRAVTADEIEE